MKGFSQQKLIKWSCLTCRRLKAFLEAFMLEKVFFFNDYQMRLIEIDDIDLYYEDGFLNADEEANYFTGTTDQFTKEQIANYVKKIVADESRYDFIILSNNRIVGEVVINNIEQKNCHYRICIFKKEYFSKGIGFEATKRIIDFAFNGLNLETIELEVFPFNDRGIALYKKLGFEIVAELNDESANEPYKKLLKMRLSL